MTLSQKHELKNRVSVRCVCGYNAIHIVSNLYECRNCGFVLLDKDSTNKQIPLVKTDLRKFILKWGYWDVVETHIYQLDILKLLTLFKSQGMFPYYCAQFKRVIQSIDKFDGKQTDFNRDRLPRVYLDEEFKDYHIYKKYKGKI